MHGQTQSPFGLDPGPYRKNGEPLYPRHDRTPGSEEDDLLAAPEPSIGAVLSAGTNKTKKGWKRATSQQRTQRIGLAVLGAIFVGLFGIFAGQTVHELLLGAGLWYLGVHGGTFAALGGIGGLVLGAVVPVVLLLVLRRPQSSLVGKEGLQRYTRGLLFGPKVEVLRFADANELKVARIRQFVNGVYTGTNYDYTWRDPSGRKVFRISGQYRDENKLEPHDPAQFAAAAEASWSAHRIAHFDRMIAQEGIARFPCGRDSIGVGKGFLEIGVKGATERITVGDTKDIFFEQGALVIKKRDAKEGIFRSEGVYRFPVASLPDFRVFLFVLEEQTGIKFR